MEDSKKKTLEEIKINHEVNTKLTFIYGPMYSGKSKKLIEIIEEYQKNKEKILILKPMLDTRNGNFLFSRFNPSKKLECHMIEIAEKCEEYINNASIIAIDEYQFLKKNELEKILKYILNKDKTLIIAGLDMDINREYWENFELVQQLSKVEIHMYAKCSCCRSKKAPYSYLKTKNKTKSNIQIESQFAEYLALCGECFEEKISNRNNLLIK